MIPLSWWFVVRGLPALLHLTWKITHLALKAVKTNHQIRKGGVMPYASNKLIHANEI